MLGLYVDFWQGSHGASDREVRFIVQLISALFAINSISNWAQICCHKNFHPFVSGLYPKSHYIDFIPLPQYNPSKNVFFKKKKKKRPHFLLDINSYTFPHFFYSFFIWSSRQPNPCPQISSRGWFSSSTVAPNTVLQLRMACLREDQTYEGLYYTSIRT